MLYGEQLALIFDRDLIAEAGIAADKAFAVIEALRSLAEHAVKFRARQDSATASIDTMGRVFELTLRAAPEEGSIRIPLWGYALAGVLSVAANASQVSGVTLRDVLAAVHAARGESMVGDKITNNFVRDRSTQEKTNNLLRAATASGCTYVAVERGNEVVILHGGAEARFSLIGTRAAPTSVGIVDNPSKLEGEQGPYGEVYYRGKKYTAFTINPSGSKPTEQSRPFSAPVVLLIWGSQKEVPQAGTTAIQSEEVNFEEVTHGQDIPESFYQAHKVFFVKGAAPLNYE